MMRPHPVRLFVLVTSLFCFFLVCAHQLRAQSDTAQLAGLVTDSTNAMLPHANVLIVNRDTGVSRQVQTDGQGQYLAPALQPGHYRITVEARGFQTLVTENVTLNVGQNANLGFHLKAGSQNQTVTVDGSGLQINTTDASVSTVVDRNFVENIPLNGRSFQDLISLTPGVVTQSPQSSTSVGNNGDFSVNGQRTESNYYTVDGVSGNTGAGSPTGSAQTATGGTVAASTALGTTQSLLSVDALQEFRIESSTYSAEYGRTPGGQFTFITRSGTNTLHGSAYDFLRNNFFDANDWFNDHYGKAIAPLRQNDFGGTVGGPIVIPRVYDGRNATFFFISYEGLRLVQPQAASIQYVPDTALRQSAPAALQPILNAFPLPSVGGIDSGTLAQFIESYSLPGNVNSTSIRVDHKLSDKLSLFFRYGDTPSFTESRTLSAVQTQNLNTRSFTLGATAQLSSRFNNDFRLGYTQSDSILHLGLDGFGGAVPIDLANAMGLTPRATAYSLFYIAIAGTGASYLLTDTASNGGRQWNAVDTTNLSLGHHQLKLGVDYRRIFSPLTPPTPYAFAEFASKQSILNNALSYLSVQRSLNASPLFNQFSLFAQDEWRVHPRLSLALGLRWELNPPPSAQDGLSPYTVLGSPSMPSTLSLAPQGTKLWNTGYYNFAPRLGAAFRAHTVPGWETVLRAGGGVFFDTNNSSAAKGFSALGFTSFHTYSGTPLPITSTQLDFPVSIAPPYTNAAIYAFPSHLQLPYTLQWNTSLEQAIGPNQSLTLSYVGSNGRRLQQQQSRNVTSSNPNFGYIYYFPTGLSSSYNALQVKFQRSVSRGVQALASYTWSHSLDFGSTDSSLPLSRGNSDFDVRNNFEGGLSWELPSVRGNRVIAAVLNHWGLDGRLFVRTAFPITILGNTLTNPITGIYTGNVNIVAGQPLYLYGAAYPGGRSLNHAAFSLPVSGDPGNAPRNFIRGFGANQVNIAAKREFHIADPFSLQFRAEAFNILNHPNFGFVDPMLTDATFGQATKTLAQSLGTVSSLYQQGGSRAMQFALKLRF